jgi:PEP-CTERM motif
MHPVSSRRVRLALLIVASSALPNAFAQTADIGYYYRGTEVLGYSDIGFQTSSFGDGILDGFINTGSIQATHVDSFDPSGQSGNGIIVTPIPDPVLHFDTFNLTNTTLTSYTSVTFRLPQYTPSDPDYLTNYRKLGFLKTAGATTFGRTGFQSFNVAFLDPIVGTYDGEAAAFVGMELYSTLHFWGDPGVVIGNSQLGEFSFFAAYPAASHSGPLNAFFMDVVPGTDPIATAVPNTTFFNTPGNPGGGIRVVTTAAPEPTSLLLSTLGLVGLAVRRRRG